MKVIDILKYPSLENATVLAGKEGLHRQITSVNVLEAPDVENWGREGMILLSSLFALQEFQLDQWLHFFRKLHQLKIAGLILKIDRLVKQVPKDLIDCSNQYKIPLIEISSEVKYESITLDILSPIINKNSQLLKRYYYTHNKFTKLSLKLLSFQEILKEMSLILENDLTLQSDQGSTLYYTNEELITFSLQFTEQASKKHFSNYPFHRVNISYPSGTKGTALLYKIPFVKNTSYTLIIHENKKKLTREEWIIIENAINLLQVELLKDYSKRQGEFLNYNNLVHDILHNKLSDNYSLSLALSKLKIDTFDYYRILQINLHCQGGTSQMEDFPPIFKEIRSYISNLNIPVAFYEHTDRITFLLNTGEESDFDYEKFHQFLLECLSKEPQIYVKWTCSSQVKQDQISRGAEEAYNMHKLFNDRESNYLIYEELGVLKLFLEMKEQRDLLKYIPSKYISFYEKDPDLFKTLLTFLNYEQNYTTTAEKLYLHPKSIKYRIDKIKSQLSFDFDNPEEVLEFQMASRILELIQHEE